ncbi:S8 family serine peptidase [Kocuria sp.]|uniref:S8 family serine peptidase n=1 Tax=Kocuria sp. TaxID=1871328 RepID=UPI002810B61F|nr:S8 family serine peptidase [Kocuria sp.]
MSAPTAWDGYTGKGTTIGVVDTGFAPHPDLSSKVVGGHDFISTTNLSNDGDGRDANAVDSGTCSTRYGQCYGGSAQSSSSWHGTHAAGTAGAARNNGGVAGIAPTPRCSTLAPWGPAATATSPTSTTPSPGWPARRSAVRPPRPGAPTSSTCR